MQDKNKVTLYLPPELHRQLKIRSAVELEPMSAIAERAIVFYLNHSEVVDEVEAAHGQNHRIYNCPECSTALMLKQGDVVPVDKQPGILADGDASSAVVEESSKQHFSSDQWDEGELVPC